MAKIFGLAITLHVWLEKVPEIEDNFAANIPHFSVLVGNYNRFLNSTLRNLGLLPKLAMTLFNFLLIPYWRRMWIIRELALGPPWMSFFWRRQHLPWKPVYDFWYLTMKTNCLIWLVSSGIIPDEAAFTFQSVINKMRNLVFMVMRRHHMSHRDAQNVLLPYLLPTVRLSLVLDDRDRVYGMLALLPDGLSSAITPSYSLSVGTIYPHFTKALMQVTDRLDLVLSECLCLEDPSLPSWVIDFRSGRDFNEGSISSKLAADAGAHHEARFLETDNVLLCKGFQVDVVDGICHTYAETTTICQPSQTGSVYQDAIDLKTALSRVLVCDPTYEPQKGVTLFDIPWLGSDEPEASLLEEMDSHGWAELFRNPQTAIFQRRRLKAGDFNRWGVKFEDLFPHEIRHCKDSSQAERDLITCSSRSIITTNSGCVGDASVRVQHGDLIYVIFGSSWPVVLRPKGRHFEVTGLCYVDGLMRGEGMDTLGRGDHFVEGIHIC